MRRVLLNLALTLGTVAFMLVLVEQTLRFLDFEYSPLEIQAKTGDEIRLQHAFEDDHFVADPELVWRPRAGVDVFNEQGFRGLVLDQPKPDGQIRVFTVGDSNTLGWAGPAGAHWPGELGQLLRKRSDRYVVVNAGVWGYSSYQGQLRLREVLPYEPDFVFISFGSNDAHPVTVPDRDYVVQNHRPGGLRSALRGLRLGRWLLGTLGGLGGSAAELRARVELPAYRETLESMVADIRDGGARAVLLTRPYIGGVLRENTWKSRAHEYNRATAEVAWELDVPLIDFYSVFKVHEDLFQDESHFTADGHRRAARIALDAIEPLLPE